MQCPCGGETKPYWNITVKKKVVGQITECAGCGRVHKKMLDQTPENTVDMNDRTWTISTEQRITGINND
jgi:uncharacterized Zn finger protein|tara:strand:- start:566 stop:772 length:207 start_codon:yes stop_codon:yes gene_type:complete